ncbi:tetratricopeptide repeat protein [Pseudomonas sp. 32.2.56]|uniref:tetratricopeptide repeat protein n=1 Tax=Pseudomonas sp. 32.2.56 TaxID=2969303 RepID=UPI00214F7F76|nr:tetratricopeptide repeat protein [Pseudomonas sp. 32.2.56]MCR4510915.1 tetratricopeptide repeat protein [Pseudomonas sp. 32.2.56]
MSLVNDMLRDLETRRAAPNERVQLEGLYAVDEEAAARRDRFERMRRGSIWFMAVILIGVLVGLMIGRVVKGVPDLATVTRPVAPAPVVQLPVQVLDVLPQHDARGLVLQLLLDRSVTYQRSEESGAVSLRLKDTQLVGEPQQSRVQRDGRSLSWRVENKGADVQILLVGLGDSLDVRDRLEAAGDRWMLWVEVPLNTAVAVDDAPLALDNLPLAEAAPAPVEAPMPAWVSAPLPAPAAAPPAAAQPAPVASAPQVKIATHQPDPLTLARQALQDGDNARAISLLEPLHKSRGQDPDVLRWLARAYLAAGDQQRLLTWLPAQLAQLPDDSELRLLLARAQLQAGDTEGAVATLEQNPPRLEQEPTYFALLAASYQQTGQWQNSAELYRRMTALRPTQSTWQLGLAIALEQLDQPAEAGRHYRLALQGQGLDDSARRFASERAKALGGR